jgi:anti-sigma regulatory factor (Ser/Thr protein kinase)
LERLAGWIEGWAQQDLSPDLSFAVQLCLEEAVANIIMHSVANGRLEIAERLSLGAFDRCIAARTACVVVALPGARRLRRLPRHPFTEK